MAFSVSGKTAIVTGAGSGINYNFAKLLLENGCNVVLADLVLRPEAEHLMKLYGTNQNASTAGQSHPRTVFQKTDVTDWVQLEAMFKRSEKEFGHADIVCPGAGVFEPVFSNFWNPPDSPSSRDSQEDNRYITLDINLVHPIRTTQLAIAHFLKHRCPGSIVHVSSIAGQIPGLGTPLYAASKHAISGFVRSLAQLEKPPVEQIPSIRVTGVAPGLTKTPLWETNPEKAKWINEKQDCWTTSEEVAEAMLDLVQNDEYIGGTVLEVGHNSRRRVAALNDPGPSGPGFTASNIQQGRDEVWKKLAMAGWGVLKPEGSVSS